MQIDGLTFANKLKFLAKDSVVYGMAGALSKLFSLISLPILTRCFTVSEYGIVDLFATILTTFSLLVVFGQDSAVARYFYEYKSNQERRELISESLLLQLLVVILVCPAVWLFSDNIIPLYTDFKLASEFFTIVLAQVPFLILINFSQNLLKWSFKRNKFLFISLGSNIALVASIVGLQILNKITILNIFIVYLYLRMFFGLLGLYFVREWLVLPSSTKYIKSLIRFAAPLGLVSCLSTFMPLVERMFVISKLSAVELGFYGVANKLSMLLSLPIYAFQMAWGPFSLSIYKEHDSIVIFNLILKIFSFIILGCLLFILLFSGPLINLLVTNKYNASNYIIYPMLLSLALESISWITMVGIGFSKKSIYDFYSSLAYFAVSFFSSLYFVNSFGIYGVAWGSLVGTILKSILGTMFAQRVYRLDWLFGSIVLNILLILLLGSFIQVRLIINEPVGILSSIIIFLMYLVFSFLILFMKAERQAFVDLILKKKTNLNLKSCAE